MSFTESPTPEARELLRNLLAAFRNGHASDDMENATFTALEIVQKNKSDLSAAEKGWIMCSAFCSADLGMEDEEIHPFSVSGLKSFEFISCLVWSAFDELNPEKDDEPKIPAWADTNLLYA
jgi:hypothetical protein